MIIRLSIGALMERGIGYNYFSFAGMGRENRVDLTSYFINRDSAAVVSLPTGRTTGGDRLIINPIVKFLQAGN
jgi:hypothetical protein